MHDRIQDSSSSLLCFARAGAVPAARRQLRRRPGDQDHDLRDLRAEPRAAGRQHRAGLLRPGGLLRHRRLRGGAAVAGERRRPSLLWLLPACVAAAALYALVVGALSLRTKGVYFIMVTLAFAQMAYFVVHDTPLGGGTDGIYLYIKPVLGALLDLDEPLRAVLLHAGLPGARSSPSWRCCCARASAARWPASASTNSACAPPASRPTRTSWRPSSSRARIAGLAGFLFAVKDGYVNPELLSWHQSGAVLIMIILGGLGHLRGALIGAFAFALLQEFFKSEAIFGAFAKHWHLGLGPDDHRQRGAAAARPGRPARRSARAAGRPRQRRERGGRP